MKTILITATAVGAVIAGLILYLQGSDESRRKIKDAVTGGYREVENNMKRVERPMQHSMG